MGTSQSTVARLESGGAEPGLSTLRRFARATGARVRITLEAYPKRKRARDRRAASRVTQRIRQSHLGRSLATVLLWPCAATATLAWRTAAPPRSGNIGDDPVTHRSRKRCDSASSTLVACGLA